MKGQSEQVETGDVEVELNRSNKTKAKDTSAPAAVKAKLSWLDKMKKTLKKSPLASAAVAVDERKEIPVSIISRIEQIDDYEFYQLALGKSNYQLINDVYKPSVKKENTGVGRVINVDLVAHSGANRKIKRTLTPIVSQGFLEGEQDQNNNPIITTITITRK
jgi:hypothetical protein